MRDFVKKRVATIRTKREYDEYIGAVRLSNSSMEQKEEVISYAASVYPMFAFVAKHSHHSILFDIQKVREESVDVDGYT